VKSTCYKITFALLLSLAVANAQGLLPKLGEQRAGTAAVTFLKIGAGARGTAMGGAYTAMATDASASYWNPAGLVQSGKNELVLSHLDWLVDVDFEYAAYVQQLGSNVALSAFVGFLHLADMPVTTEYHPYGNGEYFSYSDLATGLSVSIKMTDRFSFGATAKYVREDIAELNMDGFLFDFGTFYWTGYKTLRIAASVRNFGLDFQPDGRYTRREKNGVSETEYESFSAPAIFTLGAAMDVYNDKHNALTLSAQMNHPMDVQENLVMGLEYRWRELFALRAGYLGNVEENRWTFGAGAHFPVAGTKLKIDYSYADFSHFSMTQQITFGFEF